MKKYWENLRQIIWQLWKRYFIIVVNATQIIKEESVSKNASDSLDLTWIIK